MKKVIQLIFAILIAWMLRTAGLPGEIETAISEPAATAVVIVTEAAPIPAAPAAWVMPEPVAPMPAPITAVTLPHLHPTQPTTGGDYRQWGGEVRYCFFGSWPAETMATMLSGFTAWHATGIIFLPADSFTDCMLHVSLENMGDNWVGGMASSGPGIWQLVPGWIRINSYYPLSPETAAHEVGHILGLLHWQSGIMVSPSRTAVPGPAEIDAVRAMWGTP